MSETHSHSDEASSIASATIRLRSDIQWIAYPDTGRWVALDPIANAYYYFNSLEHQAALLFDGTRSVYQVFEAIKRVYLGSALSVSWIETFVQKLFRAQLIEAPVGFQTGRLMAGGPGGSFIKSLLTNPLSIRVPLFRPSIHYAWARGIAELVFSRGAICGLILGLLCVSYLVASSILSRPNELLYDVAKIQGDRWLVLVALLVAIKSIHELGHYLACVYLKVRCAEIGALILCFTPCLYCDTTESWRLSSRWHRAGIAAAGIYFEFWIALLGGLLFLNTQSGLIHILGGGMWVMCTLGTLVLNANPFFRYDGYFILSDLIGAPNLGSQSSNALWETMISLLGGRSPQRQDYDLPILPLAGFALLSAVYRWIVLFSIVYFLWHFLVPMGFGLYFLAIGAAIAFGIVRTSAGQIQALASELFAPEPISPRRFMILGTLFFSMLLGAFLLPLPNRTVHRGYIEFSDAAAVYAPSDGTIQQLNARIDDPNYSMGQPQELIVELDNPELRLERIIQEHAYLEIASRVEVYKQAAVSDETLAAEIPTLDEMKSEAFAKLQLIDEQLSKLKIVSPSSGRFVPKTGWSPTGFSQGVSQRSWQTLLSTSNQGRKFKRGELLGWFTATQQREANVLVTAETIRSIDKDTRVVIVSDSNPNRTFQAKVVYYSSDPIPYFPNELAGDPAFVLQRDERGAWQADVPLYKVRLDLVEAESWSSRGGACTARFELPRMTIAQRLYRFIASQFKAN